MRAIEEIVKQIKEASVSAGLVINEDKTKYVKVTRNITNLEQDLIKDGQYLKGFRIVVV